MRQSNRRTETELGSIEGGRIETKTWRNVVRQMNRRTETELGSIEGGRIETKT